MHERAAAAAVAGSCRLSACLSDGLVGLGWAGLCWAGLALCAAALAAHPSDRMPAATQASSRCLKSRIAQAQNTITTSLLVSCK